MNQSESVVDICPNFTWLGRSGIKEINGIRIAFVSGIDSDILGSEVQSADATKTYLGNYFVKADIERVFDLYKQNPKTIDILLVCQWPLNISSSLND